MSSLLLTACIGSAEAKRIDATPSDSTIIFHLAGNRSASSIYDAAAEELNDELKRLLASYGIAAESPVIDLEKLRKGSPEVAAAGENEEDSPVGEEMWLGANKIAGGHADSLFNESFLGASNSTEEEPSATSASSVAGNVAAKETETNISFNYSLVDPPVVVAINPTATPKKTKTDKKEDTGGGSVPATTAEVVKEKPGPGSYSAAIEEDQPKIKTDRPKKNDEKKPTATPSEIVIDPISIPATSIPAIVEGRKPIKLKKTPKSKNGSEVELPNEGIAASPAPVPEPATVLLLTAGIASLAIGGVRRNKPADPDSAT